LRRDFEQNPLKLVGTAEESRRVLTGLGVRQALFGREELWVIDPHAVSTGADPSRFPVGSRTRAAATLPSVIGGPR
jgi:hypothetical protein